MQPWIIKWKPPKAAQVLTHTTVLSACLLQGDKYLVLKKKYRLMLQERVGRHPRADVDGPRHTSPARSPATAPWDATHKVTCVSAGTLSNNAQKSKSQWKQQQGHCYSTRRLSSYTKMPLLARAAAIPLQGMEVMWRKHLQKNRGQHNGGEGRS